jgi:hypothetical protein
LTEEEVQNEMKCCVDESCEKHSNEIASLLFHSNSQPLNFSINQLTQRKQNTKSFD